MRTRSVRPSPDMSARKIDSVPSANTSFGPFSSSKACGTRCAGPKPVGGQRSVPPEGVVFADQEVGKPVAGEIDEFEVGVAPVQHRQRLEGSERLPVLILGALEESRASARRSHQVELAVAGKIHQLLPAAAQGGKRGLARDQFYGRELRRGVVCTPSMVC